jgi:hypothetical protein
MVKMELLAPGAATPLKDRLVARVALMVTPEAGTTQKEKVTLSVVRVRLFSGIRGYSNVRSS